MSEPFRQSLRRRQSLLEPGLRRMLLISFVLHLIVPLLLSGVLKVTHKTIKLPVYRVNLVNKPVKDPQAGRPDAVSSKKKKTPKKTQIKKKAPSPKVVKPKVKAQLPVAQKKVTGKLNKTAKSNQVQQEKEAEKSLQKRLAEMRAKAARQKKLEALKAAINAQQEDIGRPDVKAPVGEPAGKGHEIGVSAARYVESFIAEQWRLSPYQSPLDLEAEVKVDYSAAGKQGYWEMVRESGNRFFDDSVKRAIIRSVDLGYTLPAAATFNIVFNLKDLQNR